MRELAVGLALMEAAEVTILKGAKTLVGAEIGVLLNDDNASTSSMLEISVGASARGVVVVVYTAYVAGT